MRSRVGSFAVIFDDRCLGTGKVLLCRLSYIDLWSLPEGGVERGETPVEAVEREVLEETGLEVEVRRLVGIFTGGDDMLVFCFECSVTGGTLTSSAGTVGFGHFAAAELPVNFSSLQRDMVAAALADLSKTVFQRHPLQRSADEQAPSSFSSI